MDNGLDKKKVSRLQVPNDLIIDENITHTTFWLYVHLKRLCFEDNKVNIYYTKLMNHLGWIDRRTLVKHLSILEKLGYIKMESKRLVKYEPMKLFITKFPKNFTQIDIDTLNDIIECTKSVSTSKIVGVMKEYTLSYMAIRLFFYYEKNYNVKYGKAFPSYRKISGDLGMGKSYISVLNDIFNEHGLVDVWRGEWIEQNIGNDIFIPRRMCNSYIPKCNRAVSNKAS